ncbi:conserved hypothetical protein [Xanthomonas citri pv. citri]|nr:conserved hypothetical protein [Xanthomonas citri pv. citri]
MFLRKKTIESDRHADLAAQARAMTGKLSAKVEGLLAEYIAKERHSHSAGALELQRATSEWKAFTEAHGSFADEFPRCDRPARCSRQCRPEHEHPYVLVVQSNIFDTSPRRGGGP